MSLKLLNPPTNASYFPLIPFKRIKNTITFKCTGNNDNNDMIKMMMRKPGLLCYIIIM